MKKSPIASAIASILTSRALVGLTRTWVESQQRKRYVNASSAAEVSPWRIIWIDPRTVRGVPMAKGRIYPQSDRVISHVLDGDWDLHTYDFWELEAPRAIYQRIVHGTKWEETDLVARLTHELAAPGARTQWHGCRTPSDVLARCARIDRLIENIREQGFRAPPGIRPGESGLTQEYPPDAVSIGIGRDGDLLHLNGKHRFAIAASLGLDEIPVRVGVRHAAWQALRTKHLTEPGQFGDHSDVAFLRPNP